MKRPPKPDLELETTKLPIKSGNAFHLTSTINIKNSKRQNLLTFFFRQNEAEEDTCRNFSAKLSQAYTKVNFFLNYGSTKDFFSTLEKKVPVALLVQKNCQAHITHCFLTQSMEKRSTFVFNDCHDYTSTN